MIAHPLLVAEPRKLIQTCEDSMWHVAIAIQGEVEPALMRVVGMDGDTSLINLTCSRCRLVK